MVKVKILMVCLGNICRSPLAQGILESKVNPRKVFVDWLELLLFMKVMHQILEVLMLQKKME
jgi:hypothetical protein